MSAEEFRGLASKAPAKRKRRRETKDFQDQASDLPRCPTGCEEGWRLYHEVVVAYRRLREHRESHEVGR